MFKLHDLVRVKEQPSNQFVQIKGLVAVITEVEEGVLVPTHYTITELQLTGVAEGGSGAVPESCLESPQDLSGPMRAAYTVYKRNMLQWEAEQEEETGREESKRKKKRRATKLVADKHGLDAKLLRTIMKDLEAAGVISIYD